MTREILPPRRQSQTFDVTFHNVVVTVNFGHYDDGRIGEVFLSTLKAGTAVDVAARDTAVLISLLLQYGCSAKIMSRALTADAHGRPEGLAGQIAQIIERETRE